MDNKRIKKYIRFIWLILIIIILGYYFYNSNNSEENVIADFIHQYQDYGLLILFMLHLVRGLTMLPPTLLIFAGVWMYPNDLELLLLISTIGATFSGAVTYHFADKLDFKDWLKKRQGFYDKIKSNLQSRYGQFFVVGWVLFPFVPTDIIGYTAGSIKMPFLKYITAYFVGKLLLSVLYIYGSDFILEFVN